MHLLEIIIIFPIKYLNNSENIVAALEDGIDRHVHRDVFSDGLRFFDESCFFVLSDIVSPKNPVEVKRNFLQHIKTQNVENVFIRISGESKSKWDIYFKYFGAFLTILGGVGTIATIYSIITHPTCFGMCNI